MSAQSIVLIALMAFVLLVPTMMVAVLVSGLSRRTAATDRLEGETPDQWQAPQASPAPQPAMARQAS